MMVKIRLKVLTFHYLHIKILAFHISLGMNILIEFSSKNIHLNRVPY